jgi:hypothetical protein
MAAYEILSRQDPYFIVRVLFAELVFEQLLFSMKTGAALDACLKSYADAYETDWFLLQDIINVN